VRFSFYYRLIVIYLAIKESILSAFVKFRFIQHYMNHKINLFAN